MKKGEIKLGMKDDKGNIIPNIGFLSEIKFILSENH